MGWLDFTRQTLTVYFLIYYEFLDSFLSEQYNLKSGNFVMQTNWQGVRWLRDLEYIYEHKGAGTNLEPLGPVETPRFSSHNTSSRPYQVSVFLIKLLHGYSACFIQRICAAHKVTSSFAIVQSTVWVPNDAIRLRIDRRTTSTDSLLWFEHVTTDAARERSFPCTRNSTPSPIDSSTHQTLVSSTKTKLPQSQPKVGQGRSWDKENRDWRIIEFRPVLNWGGIGGLIK